MHKYTHETLAPLKINELRALAKTIGMETPRDEGKPVLIERILYVQEALEPKKPKVEQVKKEPAPALTKEQIHEAVKPHLAQGMEVRFNEYGWHFRRKQKDATQNAQGQLIPAVYREDSGNFNMPLQAVLRSADTIAGLVYGKTA